MASMTISSVWNFGLIDRCNLCLGLSIIPRKIERYLARDRVYKRGSP